MSAGQESSTDLIAIACVVEASLSLAREWRRILMEYVYPLLKRLNELHPTHQFCLAFVTYGTANEPILSKRFFAPLSQITKELREDPGNLGIGATNSGGGRGLSALEGLVAAIELFDILMSTSNFTGNQGPTQSPQKESRSLISHLLHIAATPPNSPQRPHCNNLSHLDAVNWDSMPSELKKRKINLSLIGLKKIPQFQDLQSSVAGSGVQSPWFDVRAPHTLLLCGFPAPQKTGAKRQPDPVLSDQSPDSKRQKVGAEPVSKMTSTSPALTSARTTQNQRSQQPVSAPAQQLQHAAAPGQHSSSAPTIQNTTSAPASTSATAAPALLPPSGLSMPVINSEVLEQVINPSGLKFGQMMDRMKVLEREIAMIESKISSAQSAGQAAIVAGLQKDLAPKAHMKDQIKMVLKQHYQKMLLAKEALNAQISAAGPVPPGSTNAGSSIPSHPPNASSSSNERQMGPTTEDHKPVISDLQSLAQFWQSRGGTLSTPSSNNPSLGPSQTQPHPTMTPEVLAQMQKLIEKKGIRPPNFGPSAGTTSEIGGNSNVTNAQLLQAFTTSAWQGIFSWNFPHPSSQGNGVQINIIGIFVSPTSIPSDVRTDTWPKNLTLNPCKEPLKDNTEVPSWLRRHKGQAHVMQFRPNPGAPDGPVNEQKFQTLNKFMSDRRMFVYAGWPLPSGKFSYNMVVFPTGNFYAGAVFPDGLPDLPGNGNTLDVQVQPPAEETRPLAPNGLNFPPAFLARIQNLDPARQRHIMTLLRAQQEQRRQQSQQAQQAHAVAGQGLNSLGMSVLSNPYNMVTNMTAGTPANANTNVGGPPHGTYNTGGGTVNYEMLQSFMQRSVEGGSTSQGMNPAQMS